jgi:hypothetical protein
VYGILYRGVVDWTRCAEFSTPLITFNNNPSAEFCGRFLTPICKKRPFFFHILFGKFIQLF